MIASEELEERLKEAFPNGTVEVEDLTGTQDHYKASIVDASFSGKGTMARHRAVYAVFKDIMGGALHALSLDTKAPDEV